ncbi:hypothetical protein CEXT_745731 [Caerostris extrusa]|uniref:Uncharacterized protein n=1 Tax=Caerostris extrusa TaxID=172846 RepID=A0AAV4TM02_CAEEX|nr:hypothetical protein CEXT_745731 [Caerostris extrusa]
MSFEPSPPQPSLEDLFSVLLIVKRGCSAFLCRGRQKRVTHLGQFRSAGIGSENNRLSFPSPGSGPRGKGVVT